LLSLSACLHPHEAVIPIDPGEWDGDFGLQLAIHRLNDHEHALLVAWLGYAELTWYRGDRILPGTTVGEAMHAQRHFQREEHARRLLEKKLGRLLPIITTRPVLYRLSKPGGSL
jgi:hypothetical protein